MHAGRLGTPISRAIVVLLVLLPGSMTLSQPRPDDDSFAALYRRGSEVNAQLKTLSAHFTETTTSELLSKPLVATGTVAVQRPSLIVLHYEQPERRDVLIDGDALTVSWPGRQIRDVTNIGAVNRRIQRYFVDRTTKQLEDSFVVTSEKATERPHAYLVTLVPRRKQIREALTKLELWVDEPTVMPSAMRMTFPNGETKLMALDHVVTNEPIAASVFAIAR